MKSTRVSLFPHLACFVVALTLAVPARAADSVLLGWNNLGMHCMDSDYSVFSILPPYNTIEAQLIVGGKLVRNGAGYTVTYQAMADPAGSINTTSSGKGNFYGFVSAIYGASLNDNQGLAGWNMPGPNNTPQAMLFENANEPAPGVSTPVNWFRAEGIPITPYDDAGQKNPYPMMLLVARDTTGQVLGTSSIVLPVSDEMDCRACHASGTGAAAQPDGGWVNDPNPERDYRLNILRLHDERQFAGHGSLYLPALATNRFNPGGLFANVMSNGAPVLCATCHSSPALGTAGFPGVPSLTASVHSRHATVTDPVLKTTLDNANNRAACYRCHPGSTTKCLRGAMGAAVAQDGSVLMQCQSCHGTMSQVGAANRVGWFMEPNCQACHTGTALNNNGQIRFTSVFADSSGTVRQPVDLTFATTPDTPAPGLSLYRFSTGHGGLQCEACHGSTHAEFPTTHTNDNVRNFELQGHAGVLVECTACHVTAPNTVSGGPHGMHPIGQSWVDRHGDLLENGGVGNGQCRACHGLDYRGTVLSRAQANRALATEDRGTVRFYRGQLVGCYNCHNGPGGSSDTVAPTVKITVPTSSSTFGAGGASLSLGGTAADAAGVARVTWSNNRGGSGSAVGTLSWAIEAVPLQPGVNVITVTAYDTSGNSGRDTLTVTYSTTNSLTILTSGSGSVSPVLKSQSLRTGTRLTLTATAAPGNLFANWTGSILGNTRSVTFTLASNMVLQANFVTNPFPVLKGTYTGLFSDATGAAHQGAGAFAVNLSAGGSYSAQVQTGGKPLACTGRFDLAGGSRVSLPRSGMPPLSLELQLDVAHYLPQITGKVSDGSWTSTLSGYRAAGQNRTRLYTMVIPGADDFPTGPAGCGWGTLVTTRAGQVRLSAALADGTKFTGAATISADGHWPLYASLYSGQGHVWSWMSFTNGTVDGLSGALTWVKPNTATTKYYPGGFTFDTIAWGSVYRAPLPGNSVPGFTNGVITLNGGGLGAHLTNYFVLAGNNRATRSDSLSLAFTPASGVFQGRALDANAAKWIVFRGVVLQGQSIGWGYFLGDRQVGTICLQPQ
jgi:hypothetical protein